MAGHKHTVWVVDDSPSDAAHARKALESSYHVVTFEDGASVLEALHAAAPPDVLVIDWVMPGISGLEVCKFIRSTTGRVAQIAILFVTAHRATEQVVEGFAAGANDYLVKPYAIEELTARVAALARAREMLARVERAEDTVARLLTLSPDPLLVIDAHGRLSYANPEAERVLGPAPALVGRPVAEILPDLALGEIRASGGRVVALRDVVIGDQVFAPTARLAPSDFEAAATISLRNVTKHRHDEARRLDFYSIIAHDLRSPLSSLLLRTDLILGGGRGLLSAELTADLHKMQSHVRSMVSLINDFLDLAQLDGGGYRIAREPLDGAELVRTATDEIRPSIDGSGLTLVLDLPAGPFPLTGDARRLMQVLNNLLSNAAKFTPPGGTVTVGLRDLGHDAELCVTDTGRGIPHDAVDRLFLRYSRLTTERSGTGLGLMIVREIVEAHGGTVHVESELGVGSTFRVRLPRGRVAGLDAQVLVVDDDDDVRETLEMLLTSHGYTVATAENGLLALTRLRGGEIPLAMILDMSMPIMSGPEVIDQLGGDPALARIPVCVVSGDLSILPRAPPGTLVLQKPIQVDRLLEFVGRHVPGVRGATATSSRR
jgi:signal transduction histidine kinase